MRKTAQAKKTPEEEPFLFDPTKETKEERETRLNAVVKKALKSIRKRDLR